MLVWLFVFGGAFGEWILNRCECICSQMIPSPIPVRSGWAWNESQPHLPRYPFHQPQLVVGNRQLCYLTYGLLEKDCSVSKSLCGCICVIRLPELGDCSNYSGLSGYLGNH